MARKQLAELSRLKQNDAVGRVDRIDKQTRTIDLVTDGFNVSWLFIRFLLPDLG